MKEIYLAGGCFWGLQKLEEEAKKRGVARLILHASEMGRKAYAKNGYQETQTVMEKNI